METAPLGRVVEEITRRSQKTSELAVVSKNRTAFAIWWSRTFSPFRTRLAALLRARIGPRLLASNQDRRPGQSSTRAGALLRSTELQVRAGFATLLLCLMVITAVSYRSFVRLRMDTAAVEHTHQVLSALPRLMARLADAETGQRGYIISGRVEYLEPYQSALQEIQDTFGELRRLTSDESLQQRRLDVLEPLVKKRLAALKEGIDLRRGSFASAWELILRGRGKQLDDRARALVAEMQATEQLLLAQRKADEKRASAVAKLVLRAGGGLALLIVAAALWTIGKAFKASHRAQEALRESEKQFRTSEAELREAQRIAHLGSWTLDLATGNSNCSEELFRIFAVDPRQAKRPLAASEEFFTPESWARLRDAQQEMLRTGSPQQLDLEVVRADGTKGWIAVHGEPERDSSGQVLSLRGTVHDVTERKRAQEALQHSATDLREAQRIAHVGSWVWDVAAGTVTWSEEMYHIFGPDPKLPPPSVPGPAELFTSASWGRLREAQQRTVEWGTAHHLDLEVVRADGTRRWVAAHGQPERDVTGNVIRVRGTVQDVTERKWAEAALQRSEADLNEAQRIAHMGSWSRSFQTGALTWSEEIYSIFGRDPKLPLPVLSQSAQLFTAESWERLRAAQQKTLEFGTPYYLDLEVVRPDGTTRWIAAHGEAERDADGNVVGLRGTAQDITERKRAAEALAQKAEELARSNADLEQFAYVASHDLKEPLRAVSGCVQLLQRRCEGKLDDRAVQYIAHAIDGTLRMETLIDGLLAFSRISTRGAKFETVECAKVLETALQNLQTAIQESGAVVTLDPLPAVNGDGTQLVSLFQNLIGNALKFRDSAPPRIHVGARRNGMYWHFSVCDNGIGIDPQYFDRIFGVFQRLHTRKEFPGTGVGLAICKKIVERHGGQIWVESVPGEGTTFHFSLSELQAAPAQQERELHA